MFNSTIKKITHVRWSTLLKSLLSVTLVIVIGVSVPLNAFAAGKTEYISELKLSTAAGGTKEEAKKALTDNGYTLTDDGFDLGFTESLYLGYKTTLNPAEAITDIAAMNMNGGYSFSEYEELVKEQKAATDKIVAILMHGVKEYRDNYAAGSPAAKYARDMMNIYKEDDSGKLMGDLLLDSSASEKQLSTIFMQASGIHLTVIERNLALACTPYGKDAQGNEKITWMERLSKLGGEGVMEATNDDSNNVRAITLKLVFELIVPELQQYRKVQEIIDQTLGTGELTPEQQSQATTIVEENYPADQVVLFSQSAASYAILSSFAYEDWNYPEIKTLADLVMKSSELESFDFHAMASVLTESEYQMMSLIGATPFISTVGNTEENWQKIRGEVETMDLKKPSTTSIYDGVDRELFNGKVAMTSESIRANNMNSDSNMLYGNLSKSAEIAMFALMGTAVATMIGAAIYSGISHIAFTQIVTKGLSATSVEILENATASYQKLYQRYYPERFTTKLTSLGRVFFGAMAVLAIVMIVFAALEIAAYFNKDYTTMPLIMMDVLMQKNAEGKATIPTLAKYDAVTQQKLNIQNNYIADLNTFGGNQWIIMYTTKDKLAGAPITKKNFVFSSSPTLATDKVSPIHRFGEKDAYNLKTATVFSGTIYGSFERDVNAFKTAGSIFTFNISTALALAVGVGFGGVISACGTMAILKKKKKS